MRKFRGLFLIIIIIILSGCQTTQVQQTTIKTTHVEQTTIEVATTHQITTTELTSKTTTQVPIQHRQFYMGDIKIRKDDFFIEIVRYQNNWLYIELRGISVDVEAMMYVEYDLDHEISVINPFNEAEELVLVIAFGNNGLEVNDLNGTMHMNNTIREDLVLPNPVKLDNFYHNTTYVTLTNTGEELEITFIGQDEQVTLPVEPYIEESYYDYLVKYEENEAYQYTELSKYQYRTDTTSVNIISIKDLK